MSEFKERLEELLDSRQISVMALSEATNISIAVIYGWLRAKHEPVLEYLIKLSDFFDCSVDYLLGLTENERRFDKPKAERFKDGLVAVMKEKGVTEYRLCKDTGLSRGRFYDWKKGKRLPNTENLLLLCRYLDCSADMLLK